MLTVLIWVWAIGALLVPVIWFVCGGDIPEDGFEWALMILVAVLWPPLAVLIYYYRFMHWLEEAGRRTSPLDIFSDASGARGNQPRAAGGTRGTLSTVFALVKRGECSLA
ncbi:MAG: hypothetical protein WC702_04905 [Patescibacteria group bacterium]|jgi:hypothetical protein